MCFGNGIGFTFDRQLTDAELFQPCCGGFLLELCGDAEDGEDVIGSTSEKPEIVCPKFTLQLDKLLAVWEKKLEPVFPCRIKTTTEVPEKLSYPRKTTLSASVKSAQPRVLIPVFPAQTANTTPHVSLSVPAQDPRPLSSGTFPLRQWKIPLPPLPLWCARRRSS